MIERQRNRGVCLATAAVFGVVALATRRYAAELPTYVWLYWGDALWAVMVTLVVAAVLDRRPSRVVVAIALAGMYAVEASQLYQAPWIDAIRRTTLGGLLLGHGFLWSDVACYTIGAAIGVVIGSRVHAASPKGYLPGRLRPGQGRPQRPQPASAGFSEAEAEKGKAAEAACVSKCPAAPGSELPGK